MGILKKFNGIFLLLVLIIALGLRIYKLGNIPPSLTSDEASLGYNAFSILKTAKDEYSEFLPIIFKSFGDYKPGLYVYLTVPFVAIFGLNEWSVRLPSALAGVFAVWLIYEIILLYSTREKLNSKSVNYAMLAKMAAFMFAVTPWHIHFSRGAWEANLSLTLTLAGIYFFIKSLSSKKYLPFSGLFFSLTLISYQGAKLSTFLVLIALIIPFWKDIKYLLNPVKSSFRNLSFTLVLCLFITSPVLVSFLQGKTGRLEVFSVFSYPRKFEDVQKILNQGSESLGDLSYYIFHSEVLNFTRGITGRWFNHFSGRFLLFEGDFQNPRHSAPNSGMLLLANLIFLPFGIFYLLKKKSNFTKFIIIWLFLSPLPAALSRDQVHAIRSLNLVIPLTLISASGILFLYTFLKNSNKLARYLFYSFLIFIYTGSIVYYLDSYFVHLSKHDSRLWDYGYKDMVDTITSIQGKYKIIKVQQSFAQPYIYFLFFQKYDPKKYQSQAKLVSSEYAFDVGYVEKLDNIYFAPIDWPINKSEHGILVAADNIRIPDKEIDAGGAFRLVKRIKYLDGNTAFNIVEIK